MSLISHMGFSTKGWALQRFAKNTEPPTFFWHSRKMRWSSWSASMQACFSSSWGLLRSPRRPGQQSVCQLIEAPLVQR
eukprot:4619555-Lingulodinium_polyedra.AAC.1